MEQATNEYTQEFRVSDPSELDLVWRAKTLQRQKEHPSCVPETVIDFVPPRRSDMEKNGITFSKKSWLTPLQETFSWSFRSTDKRRVHLLGKGEEHITYTGADYADF